jgi:putative phage-type endonuclease
MTITEKQRIQRRKFIGSSDVSIIFGVNKFQNQRELWLEKTGRLDDRGDKGSEAADIGNMVEDGLMHWVCDKYGLKMRRNQRRVDGLFAANLDGLVVATDVNGVWVPSATHHIEAKSTSNGAEWSEGVPPHVLLQVHHQFICAGTRVAYVPCLMVDYDRMKRKCYVVHYDETLAHAVRHECERWWDTYVVADVEPPGLTPSTSVLKRAVREPGKWADVGHHTKNYKKAQELLKSAQAHAEVTKGEMLSAMGDAEGARGEDGIEYTYLANKKGHRTLRERARHE